MIRWCWIELNLTAEAVQSTTLTLERIDNVHGGDGLSLGMLGVRDGISDHVLQEHLEHTAGLLVDETAQALHTTSTSETTDGLVMPWMLSRNTLRWRLAPPLPKPLPPLPRPDIVLDYACWVDYRIYFLKLMNCQTQNSCIYIVRISRSCILIFTTKSR